MDELETLTRAVEELHEADRLAELLAIRLARANAPPALVEQAQGLQLAVKEWQDQ